MTATTPRTELADAGALPSSSRNTFSTKLTGRANAFGLLRIVLASAVIFSHAFYLGDWGLDPSRTWSRGQSDIGNLAVLGFFVISGYLITLSAARLDVLAYLWRRTLRIFPAFLVVLVVGALVVGPWFYHRLHGSLDGYWSGPDGPWQYLTQNASLKMQQYGIHDVFRETPYWGHAEEASVINGSLWTLWYEWRSYLIVGALAALGLLSRFRWLAPLGALISAAAALALPHVGFVESLNYRIMGDVEGLRLASMFLLGASFAVYRNRIPHDGRLATLGAGAAVVTFLTAGFTTVGYLGYGYLVLWLAAAFPARLHGIGARNDVSYGIYIYAWPVQMALASYGVHEIGYVGYVGATLLLTVPLACASWRLVEKPCMALKDVGPGRGLAYWAERFRLQRPVGAYLRFVRA